MDNDNQPPGDNDKPNIIEKFDNEELLRQLELFESYRPDSSSDATRNPFDSKRYQCPFCF